MKKNFDGNAVVYCEGAFGTPNGKTAHGLVRRSARYRVLSVVDSHHEWDAGAVLDGKSNHIPIHKSVKEAIEASKTVPSRHPPGCGSGPGRGPSSPFRSKGCAFSPEQGLHVDSGLHDFLSEDREMMSVAEKWGL
jgi:uncharacterized NAD-dependent epimerase/dehydratase family protein